MDYHIHFLIASISIRCRYTFKLLTYASKIIGIGTYFEVVLKGAGIFPFSTEVIYLSHIPTNIQQMYR